MKLSLVMWNLPSPLSRSQASWACWGVGLPLDIEAVMFGLSTSRGFRGGHAGIEGTFAGMGGLPGGGSTRP